ncbi:MAG: carboxypeptidase regulatory-like domain-containing protein, partial [Acidobacteria bacterium]|nr:carboxypeptidase regulatory-like domain-containing protein [Acidobacteriota bacterium]
MWGTVYLQPALGIPGLLVKLRIEGVAMSLRRQMLIFFSIFLIGLAPCLMAQKGASRLEGTVKDSTGGVVPGASVIATNVDTGVAREVFSSESGSYVFPALPPGTYNVAVELTGFKRAVAENVKLDVAATLVQNLVLEVGELSETVTVTAAGAAPIQTTTSDIADTVQGQTIISLPLNGRNPLELVQLNAGIAGNRAMSERGSAASQTSNYGGLGANGARAVSNAVYLDGVDITNSEGGTGEGIETAADISQSVDAIGEFRVISANPTAEFGKNSGMQIEIVTRSGTNDLHGSLYEFHRNTVLNANDFFNNMVGVDRPKLLRNQYGGNVGGPVYIPWAYNGKNKTFFFFNYEGFRERRGNIVERTVLTDTARNGVFRYYTKGVNATGLVDPFSGQVKPEYAGLIGNFDVVATDKARWDGIGKDTSGVV